MRRRTLALLLALATAALASAPQAEARWRVVGPGIAVADAEAGSGSLAVECESGLVLAAYGYEGFGRTAPVTLVVDGTPFALRARGDGSRLVLSPPEGRAIPATLRERLAGGRRARLEGEGVAHLPEDRLSFDLAGSGASIATVTRFCQ